MRTLFAATLLIAAALPAAAQRQPRAEPAPEAQDRQACGVRQDAWGAIAPGQGTQADRARRTDKSACSKRHLIDWTPSEAAPVQRAK
jgi:hypothetical protein